MMACPRFDRCSACICPLDPDWRLRRHLDGEPVCGMASEAVKCTGKAVFDRAGAGDLYPDILRAIPEIISRWGDIRRRLERAKTTGSSAERSWRNAAYLRPQHKQVCEREGTAA
jgi:hypothetical protein